MEPRKLEILRSLTKIRGFAHPIFSCLPGLLALGDLYVPLIRGIGVQRKICPPFRLIGPFSLSPFFKVGKNSFIGYILSFLVYRAHFRSSHLLGSFYPTPLINFLGNFHPPCLLGTFYPTPFIIV